MKNLKKLMMTCLVAGTFAACSSTKTANSGSGKNDSGNMGTGSDTGTSMDTVTSGTARDTMGTSSSGSGTNNTGSIGTQSGTDNTTASAGTNNTQWSATGNDANKPTTDLNKNSAMSGTQGAMAMSVDSSSAQMFLPQAARAGMKEVEISQLALEKSKNPAVRKFATMMIRDHSQNNERLMSMGAKKNISMPNNMMTGMGTKTTGAVGTETSDNKKTDSGMPDPAMPDNTTINSGNQNMNNNASASSDLASFQNLNGSEFDTRYMQQMVQDHEQAIALYTSASQSNDAQIKAHAKKTLPVLKAHLSKAKDIISEMN